MAAPALTSYSAATGQPINGGRWPGGRLVGNGLALAAVAVAGAFASTVADLGGNVALDSVTPAGVLERDLGNVRITIWGQSNGVGVAARSELTTAPLSADSGLATFNTTTFSRVYILNAAGNAYVQLQMGTNQLANTTAQLGPEFGLAVRWMRVTSSGNLYIDKQCVGGAWLYQFQEGTSFWTDALARRAGADAWLSSNSITVTDSGWIWVQGEADFAATEAAYLANFNNLTGDMIANGLLGADERIVLAQINPESTHYGAGVAAAKVAFVAANPTKARLITYANYMNADGVHLNARGEVQLGYDGASAALDFPTVSA